MSYLSILDPLRVIGYVNSWVITCFSRPSSFLYVIIGFTFLDAHIDWKNFNHKLETDLSTDLATDLVTKISVTKIETKFMSKVHCYVLATDLETNLKTENRPVF